MFTMSVFVKPLMDLIHVWQCDRNWSKILCGPDMTLRSRSQTSNFYLKVLCYFYTPPHKKWWGIMLYPPNYECLSVSASFPCSNFSTFWSIFFKLCIDIGIGEEWYGIASGLISF